jgi:putative transposase
MSLPSLTYSHAVLSAGRECQHDGQLVTDALIMAIWRRGKPDALLHHSDQ